MRGMVLAAGRGTRLWPLTADRAKPAVPFLNRPLIFYPVEYLKKHGIVDLIVNLHHQGDSIRQVLDDGSRLGVSIYYSEEPELLGTGGALDKVRHLLEDDTFVVINGKIITDIDLHAVIENHLQQKALATLVLRRNRRREHFSIVEVDGRGQIVKFAGFPQPLAHGEELSADEAPLMFTGVQVLDPEIFRYIPRGRFSHTTMHAYPHAIAAGELVAGYLAEGQWYELSTLDRYLKASLEFLRSDGRSLIRGEGTVIEEGAEVIDTVIWQRAYIHASTVLRQCIVGDDVVIPRGSHLEEAAIIRASLCPDPKDGTVTGDSLVVYF